MYSKEEETMKKKYNIPTLQIDVIDCRDIITNSGDLSSDLDQYDIDVNVSDRSGFWGT